LKIIDRSQLILDIFAQRAQSSEGKIQWSWPNEYLCGSCPDQPSRGLPWHRRTWAGETKLEMDRRRVRDPSIGWRKKLNAAATAT